MRPNRQKARETRGLAQKLWQLSDELNIAAQHVRYANKPSDLTLPITQLLQIVRRINQFRDIWLLKWLKTRDQSLERWPRLYERYL